MSLGRATAVANPRRNRSNASTSVGHDCGVVHRGSYRWGSSVHNWPADDHDGNNHNDGAISLRSGLNASDIGSAIDSTFSPDATRFGGDIGGGLMGFMGNWGVKADLQYFRTAGQYQTPASPALVTTRGGTTVSGTTTPGTTTPGAGGNPPTAGPYVARDTTTSGGSPSSLSDAVLAGLHFWRADIGVAFRW